MRKFKSKHSKKSKEQILTELDRVSKILSKNIPRDFDIVKVLRDMRSGKV